MSRLYCVTGPMACGKNAATDFFAKRGFLCIDADRLGHAAVEQQKERIIQTFADCANERGISLLNGDATINRRALGSIVFSNEALLKKLEDIVYPQINSLIEDFVNQNKEKNIIINAAVLYKVPYIQKVNKIIYIDAPFAVRLLRARHRDKMSVRHILDRFFSQRNLFAKYKNLNADIERVWNAGSKKSLEKQLEKFL